MQVETIEVNKEKAVLFDLILFISRKEFNETIAKLTILIAEFGNERFVVEEKKA